MNPAIHKTLIENLSSKNELAVLESISKLRDEGHPSSLKALAQLWISTSRPAIKDAIYNLFCDLKLQESASEMVDLIFDPNYANIQPNLLSACWLSRIEFHDYLERFIDLVYSQQFPIAFEAFTVIENMEHKISIARKHELVHYIDALNKKGESANPALTDSLIEIVDQFDTE